MFPAMIAVDASVGRITRIVTGTINEGQQVKVNSPG